MIDYFKGQLFWEDGNIWEKRYYLLYDDYIKFVLRKKRKYRR